MSNEFSDKEPGSTKREHIVNSNQENMDELEPLTFVQVASSVFAAAFGVQSSDNKKRDFTRGKPIHFILSGILFTFLFLVIMILVVNTVIAGGS